jgi:hypothetical protein
MPQRTLLQIIQAAQGELGLAQTSVVTTATDQTTLQMYGYAQQEIEELRQRHNWTALTKEYNLIVNVPTVTTGNLAANSAVVSNIASGTSGLTAGYFMVAGSGIPAAARIQSVDSPTQITMNMEATGAVTGTAITFMQDTYPEPSDFNSFLNRTWWDRTNRWELLGPDSAQIDQWHRSGIVVTGPRRHFRQIGALANNYRIWPPPSEITAPLQLVFEYLSQNAIFVNGSTTTSNTWANDGDIPILNDRAIIMGIKWRFWEQKGFDWVAKRTDYDNYVDRLIARDGGKETINMVKRVNPIFISPANVQDGFFPGPVGPNTG